jgi:hypothetical protein
MKKEQIIEILKNPHWFLNGKLFESDFERIADAILAIPLDVPTDEEIHNIAYDYCMFEGGDEGEPEADPEVYTHFRDGMNCMRNEIIKRNK